MKSESCPTLTELRVDSLPPNFLRKHIAFWSLTFEGQRALFDHEQGAYYVAYLLLNPPPKPIHGMLLEVQSSAYFREVPDGPVATDLLDPLTGRAITLGFDAIFEQRNFTLDDGDSLRSLRRTQLQLEAILEDESASDPVKAEVEQELAELYDYYRRNHTRIADVGQKAVRAVRKAIQLFHLHLASAKDVRGNPQPVLRAFACHLGKHLLIPSARYSQGGRGRTKTGVAGRFTYEPPLWFKWSASPILPTLSESVT